MSRFTRCVVACLVLLPFVPAAQPQAPRTDALGDPLPPFAVARLGTTRLRQNYITALAFAPDGKMLAAIDFDSVRLWDSATGKLLRQLREADFGHLTAVAFSPDGKWLAVGGPNGLTVWEAAPGKHRTTMKVTQAAVRTLHFSPNGRMLVAATGTAVTVWDVVTGKRLLNLADKLGLDLIATATPDDQTLLGLSSRNMLSRWRLSDGKLLERWCPTKIEWVDAAVLSGDGKKLALGLLGGTLSVCDPATGKKYPALEEPPAKASSLIFSPDGEFLIAVSQKHWNVWRVATGQRLHVRPRDPNDEDLPFTVAPGDGTLACGGYYRVCLLDPVTGKERFPENQLAGPVWKVFFTTFKGKFVAATGETPRFPVPGPPIVVRFWDAHTGKPVGQWPGPIPSVLEIAVQPKGNLLVALNKEDQISLWNIATGKPAPPLKGKTKPVQGRVRQMTFSPDGTRFAALLPSTDYSLIKVCVWESASGKEVGALEVKAASALTLAFAPDSDTLVLIGSGAEFLFWSPTTGRRSSVRVEGNSWAKGVLWSPNGRMLAVVEDPHQARGFSYLVVNVYEVATSKRIWSFKTKHAWIRLAFSHDSRLLFVSDGYAVNARNAVSGMERGQLTGHEGHIFSLALSPDGRLLLTGSADHTTLVWDVPAFLTAMPTSVQMLRATDLQTCWADLAKLDAEVAYQALDSLIAAPAQSVSWLTKQVLSAPSLDRKALALRFSQLDDKKFAVREQAQVALKKYGELLVPILEQQLQQPTSLEMRRRLEKLLAQVAPVTPGPETLRAIRTVAVLEYVGTPDACKLLKALAAGASEARLTLEAQAALRRLAVARP